jgi:hypothetical protein
MGPKFPVAEMILPARMSSERKSSTKTKRGYWPVAKYHPFQSSSAALVSRFSRIKKGGQKKAAEGLRLLLSP